MKHFSFILRPFILLMPIGLVFISLNAFSQESQRLFYNEAAKKWEEALPLGNGRLGAMVYGGVLQEHIQFNEETLWTGEPRSYAHKGAKNYLGEIRQLIFDGKQLEAQDLMAKEFLSVPRNLMAYQPFGDLIIDFPTHKNHTDYHRELNIENAIGKVSYKANGINYTREVFVSHPDQVIAVRLTADKAGALDFSAYLDSKHFKKSVITYNDQQRLDVKPDSEAQRFDPTNPSKSVLWGQAGIKVITDGKVIPKNKEIYVSGASTATIYLTAATNFVNYQDVSGRPNAIINQALKKFENLDYSQVKKDHIIDYQSLYNRFQIKFDGDNRSNLPTNERINQFWKDPKDPDFLALYVQYGRYLM
ncbi:MAG: glycoside hydrolase family 95 protein, partial [Cyclobacteriaceae bacterium]|nr:glycoside hydrolase family 95 protein [Cyclobacteriaceae bacterium]